MPTDIGTLESLDIFEGLAYKELEQIAPLMNSARVTEGEVLTRRDDPAHTFFVILSGNFMLYFKENRAFTLHEKGDIMGWSTVVPPFKYRGTSVALTDGEILTMSAQEFLRLIQENSALSDKIMRKINAIVEERMLFVTGGQKENEGN